LEKHICQRSAPYAREKLRVSWKMDLQICGTGRKSKKNPRLVMLGIARFPIPLHLSPPKIKLQFHASQPAVVRAATANGGLCPRLQKNAVLIPHQPKTAPVSPQNHPLYTPVAQFCKKPIHIYWGGNFCRPSFLGNFASR